MAACILIDPLTLSIFDTMDRGLLEKKNEEEILARRKRLNENLPVHNVPLS